MKRLIIIFALFQILTFIYANEKSQTEDNHLEIKREMGGYYKGDKYLRTRNDFIEALSPVPQAKDLYLISVIWKYSAVSLLCTSIATEVGCVTLAYIALLTGDIETYPQYYNSLLSNIFSYTSISLFVLFIPQFVMWIVSFGQYAKKKKEAIRLYNSKVNEINDKKSSIEFYGSPFVMVDKKRDCSLGLTFLLKFN